MPSFRTAIGRITLQNFAAGDLGGGGVKYIESASKIRDGE